MTYSVIVGACPEMSRTSAWKLAGAEGVNYWRLSGRHAPWSWAAIPCLKRDLSDRSPCPSHGSKREFYFPSVCISVYPTFLTMNKNDFLIKNKWKLLYSMATSNLSYQTISIKYPSSLYLIYQQRLIIDHHCWSFPPPANTFFTSFSFYFFLPATWEVPSVPSAGFSKPEFCTRLSVLSMLAP